MTQGKGGGASKGSQNAKGNHEPRTFLSEDGKKASVGINAKYWRWSELLEKYKAITVTEGEETGKEKLVNVLNEIYEQALQGNPVFMDIWIKKIMNKLVSDAPMVDYDKIKHLKGSERMRAYCEEVFDMMIRGEATADQHEQALKSARNHVEIVYNSELRQEWEETKADLAKRQVAFENAKNN